MIRMGERRAEVLGAITRAGGNDHRAERRQPRGQRMPRAAGGW